MKSQRIAALWLAVLATGLAAPVALAEPPQNDRGQGQESAPGQQKKQEQSAPQQAPAEPQRAPQSAPPPHSHAAPQAKPQQARPAKPKAAKPAPQRPAPQAHGHARPHTPAAAGAPEAKPNHGVPAAAGGGSTGHGSKPVNAPDAAKAGKTTICHATGSATNPYVTITISNNALAAHARHQDGRDIIPAPAGGCGDPGGGKEQPGRDKDKAGKTTICHATGSATNPYVVITISDNALPAHARHQDGRDIIPAPAGGCPGSEPTEDLSGSSSLPPVDEAVPPVLPGGAPRPTLVADIEHAKALQKLEDHAAVLGARASKAPRREAPGLVKDMTTAHAVELRAADAGQLPFTGADAWVFGLMGLVLVATGVALRLTTGADAKWAPAY